MKPLPPASAEQAAVVASVLTRVHVACEAVAGSGKTKTILHCAEAAPSLKFLLLTYNARLKLQTRQRVRELGLSNLEVHSFHAMGARYYDRGCRNDEVLRALVYGDQPPHSPIAFDCLVIDEAQDLTPLLHRFVLKVLRDRRTEAAWRGGGGGGVLTDDDTTPPPSLLVLGDSRQSIYQFRDADSRFLTMADWGLYNLPPPGSEAVPAALGKLAALEVLGLDGNQLTVVVEADSGSAEGAAAAAANGVVPAAAEHSGTWRHHTLRTSFRATPNIASFVNDAMLGFKCIDALPRPERANPLGHPVTYLVGNAFTVVGLGCTS